MKHSVLHLLGLALFWLLSALPAQAELPKRDLVVELRQVEDAGGATVSTQSREPLLTPQQIRVRNGAKASLRLEQALPMQWVKAASSQTESLSGSGVTSRSSGGSVVNEVTWMDAGQSLTVQPRWPGGKQAVTVDIEVQAAAVGDRLGAELPTQSRSQTATSVSAPLGQWVTIATSGSSPARGVYSSEATVKSRRLMQLRVLAP
ncbi:MAG: type II and III secretion system protein [Rhodoferax sp.]|uniref:hypothetical protein n=1 Tax=Rhodoferax sp. TaxID=50421 RepID=UPI0017AFE4C0|nr:hypothetical protein [Rhodoferax sp.]NMM19003.1 type II and III secretion system protein [Rhodoferax sp.]